MRLDSSFSRLCSDDLGGPSVSVGLFFTRAFCCLVLAFLVGGCATHLKQYSTRRAARVILDNRAKRFRVYPRHETPIRVVLDTGPAMLCGTSARPDDPCIAVEGWAMEERMSSAKSEVRRAGKRTGLLFEDFGLLVKDFFQAHLKQRYGAVSVEIGRRRRGENAVIVKPRLTLPNPGDRSRSVVVLNVTLPSGRSLTVQDDTMSSYLAEYLITGAPTDALTGATDSTLLPIVIASVDRAVLRAVVQIEQYGKARAPSRTNATTKAPHTTSQRGDRVQPRGLVRGRGT